MTGFIYCLKNPISDTVFYVGSTIVSIEERLKQHITTAKNAPTPCERDKIIKQILEANSTVIIEELETLVLPEISDFKKQLATKERDWIIVYSKDFNLVNVIYNPYKVSRKKDATMTKEELWAVLDKVPTPIYQIEVALGMPKTTLQKAIKGERELPKKWALKLLDAYPPKKSEIKVQDATEETNVVKPKKPMGSEKSNFTVNTNPKTLDELKALCPTDLKGFDRSEWINVNRQKFNI